MNKRILFWLIPEVDVCKFFHRGEKTKNFRNSFKVCFNYLNTKHTKNDYFGHL